MMGHKYFLTLVDDYNRFYRIYLIHAKYEIAYLVKYFVAFIKTQFSKNVKIIRTNIGLNLFIYL